MRTKTLLTLAITVLLGVPAAWAQQPTAPPPQPAPTAEPAPPAQPSLADIARQNKARKARKVITDDDLPAKSPGDAAANGAAADSSAPAAKEGDTTPAAKDDKLKTAADKDKDKDAASKGESGEKTEAQADADRLAYLTKDQEAIKQQIENMRTRLENETVDTRRATWSEVLERLQNQLQKQQAELDQLKSKPGASSPKRP